YRRIEDQLRSVGRRLDNAERSQSENTRAMSQATTEINVASREQSQAFDELGTQVLGLSERLERLERHVAQDPLKDAVKGLHQGLSRLADQIGQTASHSASQISTVAGNLEQLAARLGQARADAENTTRALEVRMVSAENTLSQASTLIDKADTAAEALETRVATTESALQTARSRIDQAQEKIEAQASIRAHDLAELQRWEANHLGSLERIEERIAWLESKGPDPVIDRRLDNIEQALAGVVSRLEQSDPIAALADTLRQVNQRLDSVEKSHFEMLAELRASLGQAPRPAPVVAAPSFNPTPEPPPVFEAPKFETSAFAGVVAEAPRDEIKPEPEALQEAHEETAKGVFDEPIFQAEPAPPLFSEPSSAVAEDAPIEEGFAPKTPAFAADAPEQDAFTGLSQDAFADHFEMPQDFADAMAQSAPVGDNFLSAARRSAQAAAEAEAQRGGRSFSWGRAEGERDEKTNPRNLILLVIGFVALLAVALGLMLNHRGARPASSEKAEATKTPAANAQTSSTGALQGPQITPTPQNNAAPAAKPAAPATVVGLVPPTVVVNPPVPSQTAPQKPAAQTAALPPAKAAPAKSQTSTTDKVAAAANQGNATAETIIGLRYLDGQGISADATQALKWLQKAADAGQAVAQYRLGTMYERGQGVTANPALAAKWYLAAANQGNRKAMHNLAVSYAEGATGKKDMAESARWFSKAAALGLSDSQFNLAVLYERGDGVPQSLIDAFKWYSIAAAAGDAESRTRLGVLQTQLSETDRAAATRAAQNFRVGQLNRTANVPPEAADIASN
ncbi:MAG TPA: hypothetical protein VN723_14260, partial [Rhizomicrobium sp.]|nr:hypothetical protein [Rhizomicrobium sp.]